MKNIRFHAAAAAALSAFILVSCGGPTTATQEKTAAVKRVGVQEFRKALQDTTLLLIDVRTPKEHAEGDIPGTDLNLDVLDADFEQKAREQVGDRSSVAIYCRSGNRSKKAASILQKMGYDVLELESGYSGWVKAESADESVK